MSANGDEVPASIFETPLELVGIVAVADNGVIGRDGEMPWHIPEDLAHFQRTTMDHPVIMGRVTFEGIVETLGEPLPGRTSIVLTNGVLDAAAESDRVLVAGGIAEAINAAERAAAERHGDVDRAFVAGGATVYEQFLPGLDRLVATEVHRDPDGDARFPDLEPDRWREVDREERDGFDFVEYERTDGA